MKNLAVGAASFLCFLLILAFYLAKYLAYIVCHKFIKTVFRLKEVEKKFQSAEIALFTTRSLWKVRKTQGKIIHREKIGEDLFICIEIGFSSGFIEEIILIYSTANQARLGKQVAKALGRNFRKVSFMVHEEDFIQCFTGKGKSLPVNDNLTKA
ncbi:MAG: hypothetical protein WCF92_03185 [bacterium]